MSFPEIPVGPPSPEPGRAGAPGSFDALAAQFARDYLRDRRSERRWRST